MHLSKALKAPSQGASTGILRAKDIIDIIDVEIQPAACILLRQQVSLLFLLG